MTVKDPGRTSTRSNTRTQLDTNADAQISSAMTKQTHQQRKNDKPTKEKSVHLRLTGILDDIAVTIECVSKHRTSS